MINVPTTTFDTINSGSGSHLDFTTLGVFSEPTMGGRDLWSSGQETIVVVTLLIRPYDSSFILPDIYVVPLTCALEAQTVPELNHTKVKRIFTVSWRGAGIPYPIHLDLLFLKIIPLNSIARSFCLVGERVPWRQGWRLRLAAPES